MCSLLVRVLALFSCAGGLLVYSCSLTAWDCCTAEIGTRANAGEANPHDSQSSSKAEEQRSGIILAATRMCSRLVYCAVARLRVLSRHPVATAVTGIYSVAYRRLRTRRSKRLRASCSDECSVLVSAGCPCTPPLQVSRERQSDDASSNRSSGAAADASEADCTCALL